MTAHERFHAELNTLLDAGEGVPCLDHTGGNVWISDALDARQAAAWRCLPCPLLDACHDMAAELRPDAGVWAGTDHNLPRAKRRRIDYEENPSMTTPTTTRLSTIRPGAPAAGPNSPSCKPCSAGRVMPANGAPGAPTAGTA